MYSKYGEVTKNILLERKNIQKARMADEEKPPGGKKLPPKPPLPPRRAATASALEKKDLEKAAVLSKTRHSTSFGINDDGDQNQKTSKKPSKPEEPGKIPAKSPIKEPPDEVLVNVIWVVEFHIENFAISPRPFTKFVIGFLIFFKKKK